MYRVIAVAAAIALSMPAAATALTRTDGPSSAHTTRACAKVITQARFEHYTRAAYKRPTLTRKARLHMRRLIACHKTARAQRNSRIFRRHHKRYRAQRVAVTPHGGWAIPAYIVMCESGGDYNAQNASGAYGAYQLMPTWWGHLSRKPTPAEQDAIAAKLWAGGRGAGNWVCA